MNQNLCLKLNHRAYIYLFTLLSIGFTSCANSQIVEFSTNPPNEENKEKEISCEEKNTAVDIPRVLPQRTNTDEWQLYWEDNFSYANDQLDKNWDSQNGSSGHILSSRWRDNAIVSNGILELLAKKEKRGGQEWTTGNIWTKETFGYGYYECKYKYAGAPGTNNSFWLIPRDKSVAGSELICELDVNEGHFPNEVNTNKHHWQNGSSENNQIGFSHGLSHGYSHTFRKTISTEKIRFSSKNSSHFHIKEFRIYPGNLNCSYPENIITNDNKNIQNLAKESIITTSGVYDERFKNENIIDGSIASGWVSQKEGLKWIEFTWDTPQEIGHIQFINGWKKHDSWIGLITDYKIEAFVNNDWVEITSFDVLQKYNYAEEYHIYGMDWSEDELKFYVDNELIRTIPNTLCNQELNIFLSLAILDHAGEVTDDIDGTSMKIDWVKYYKKTKK